MIRFIFGMGLVFGAVGGMEVGDLSGIAAFTLAVFGNSLAWWPVLDGSIHRLAGVKKEW